MTEEVKRARYRFTKQIAEELLREKGAFAHLYVLEELESQRSKATHSDLMWRDVLTWLDELEKPNGGEVDTHSNERGREQANSPTDDS
jgi:hypothetical protein